MAVPPPSPAAHADKAALREALRAARAAHVQAIGKGGERAGAEAAAALLVPHIPPGAIVSVFLAFHDELDPAPLAAALQAAGRRIALPYLTDDTDMVFRGWAEGEALERGPFRMRQPLAAAEVLAPDIIVTPLLGFDRQGGRIGQGKSHYDRAFARHPGARRLGLAWSVQEVEAVPHDPWDVALHAVATEAAFIPMPVDA